MGFLQNYETYSEAEIQRWLWLRAMEWRVWPAFISQPIVPILFIFWPWFYVLIVVFLIGVIWCPIRYAFVSVRLAEVGCLFVQYLKWPTALAGCVYLIICKNYVPAAIALLWPFLSSLIGIHGKVGVVELTLAKKIGYIDKNAQL